MHECFQYNFQSGRSTFNINLSQDSSIFNSIFSNKQTNLTPPLLATLTNIFSFNKYGELVPTDSYDWNYKDKIIETKDDPFREINPLDSVA